MGKWSSLVALTVGGIVMWWALDAGDTDATVAGAALLFGGSIALILALIKGNDGGEI